MGRKKKYETPYERLKAYRQRKQKNPSKLSNQERLTIAKSELQKLTNPSRNDLIYSLCLNQNWSRTLSTEITNMLELSEGIKFTEPIEQPKQTEYEEMKKILGKDDDYAIRRLMSLPDNEKEELRGWYAKQNTIEAKLRKFETYYFLKALNEWLREKGLEFPSNYLVSEFEIMCRKHPIEGLDIKPLNEIPHDPKNRIVTDSERVALHAEYLKIWIENYPKDANHPHSLLEEPNVEK